MSHEHEAVPIDAGGFAALVVAVREESRARLAVLTEKIQALGEAFDAWDYAAQVEAWDALRAVLADSKEVA